MNFQEIVSKLNELKITKEQFGCLDMEEPLEGIGEWKCVDRYGGEGQGDSYYVVIHFKEHNIYVKLDGWYSSYDGTDFSGYDYQEVFPKQKTITVYETK